MADNAELESFRRQWREEVTRRTKPSQPGPSQATPSRAPATQSRQLPPTRHEAFARKEEEEEGEGAESRTETDITQGIEQLSLAKLDDEDAFHSPTPRTEPTSALEHFERAVEREAEGSLGDSLQHYRKAYRLDAAVDKEYRNKHFAGAWKKTPQAATSDETAKVSAPPSAEIRTLVPTRELIASFASAPIVPADPIFEGDPAPPCPIAHIPSEVIVEILGHVAVTDPAAFCRLALVCKRFAYHFAHEQHIWKKVCQGSKFGFKAMHYSFACDVQGNPEHTLVPQPQYTPFPFDTPAQPPSPLSSWSEVFHTFPRIRFTGIYISTVNYTRQGASSSFSTISWNSPIHIVTYYRYIRFYPDGTVIYLLSSVEPVDVVSHINKANVAAARPTSRKQHQRIASDVGSSATGAQDPMPAVAADAMKGAQIGRWRFFKPETSPDPTTESEYSFPAKDKAAGVPDPRDIIIEAGSFGSPKYINVLYLTLRSSTARPANANPLHPNPSRNTKLVWKGYWSYNKLTDDWGEFGLKNDRAFVFRRVRGWGMN